MSFWQQFLGFDPNRDRDFPGQQPGEVVEIMTTRHWITLVGFFLHLVVIIALIVFLNFFAEFFANLSFEFRFAINSLLITFLIHYFCMRLFNHFLRIILITNARVIEIRNSIFFQREREVIPLSNIQDFRLNQNGILPRIFKYGDLILLGPSVDVRYEFHNVPHVNRIYHTLGEIHQKVVRHIDRQQHRPGSSHNQDFSTDPLEPPGA